MQLPALPVAVKTAALPLVVWPPRPRIEGAWELEWGTCEAVAVFRTPDGTDVGFALAGSKTGQQQAMAKRMRDPLPDTAAETTQAPVDSRKVDAGG